MDGPALVFPGRCRRYRTAVCFLILPAGIQNLWFGTRACFGDTEASEFCSSGDCIPALLFADFLRLPQHDGEVYGSVPVGMLQSAGRAGFISRKAA